MACTVHYIAKDGSSAQATFPTRGLAESYARTLRKVIRIEDVAVDAAPVAIVACAEGTEDDVKQANRNYRLSWKDSSRIAAGQTRRIETSVPRASSKRATRDDSAENRAERMAEHFGAAACSGQSTEDAWDDWDYSEGRR